MIRKQRIPATLQKLREESKRSKVQLAKDIGVDVKTVTRLESGDSFPSFETIVALADLYHVSLDVITGRVPLGGDVVDAVNRDEDEAYQEVDAFGGARPRPYSVLRGDEVTPPTAPDVRLGALEERVDLLTRVLRTVAGDQLDAALAEAAARRPGSSTARRGA